jgi:D-glycero-D-manno-heptose 1,7-bisphosphate phosphatase
MRIKRSDMRVKRSDMRVKYSDMRVKGPDMYDSRKGRRAIFLDRDGVLNKKLPEDCYISDVCEFELMEGVPQALRKLKSMGFLLVVVTNQRGIARELMTEQDLQRVHQHMTSELERLGACLDGILHCPHDRCEACECRKPEPGMILKAADLYGISLEDSYLVGDRASDIEAGKRAGVKTALVGSEENADPDMRFPDLLAFAIHLENNLAGVA